MVLAVLFIQTSIFSQKQENVYPFKIEIKGHGTPIILIPGLACSGDVWQETVNTLKNNYQCHILTLPGFSTQKPILTENGFLPIMKEKVATYIKNEMTEKPILIGHSLGGFLSLSIASSYPNSIQKIIIVDSYPFMSKAFNPNATEENIIPQANTMKKMLLNTSDSIYINQQKMAMKTMITNTDKVQLAIKWSIDSDRKTIAQAMFELMTTDLREEVQNIKVPILVLGSWYGAKDYGVTKKMIQTNFQSQFSKAKDCTISIAETAKHFIMLDEPIWFLKEVNTFLNNEE